MLLILQINQDDHPTPQSSKTIYMSIVMIAFHEVWIELGLKLSVKKSLIIQRFNYFILYSSTLIDVKPPKDLKLFKNPHLPY